MSLMSTFSLDGKRNVHNNEPKFGLHVKHSRKACLFIWETKTCCQCEC